MFNDDIDLRELEKRGQIPRAPRSHAENLDGLRADFDSFDLEFPVEVDFTHE